jgi:hypothetical protein
MFRTFEEINNCTLTATDGEIGSVEDLYFDDEGMTVRYLVVDTGTWLPGRKVLISPRCFKRDQPEKDRLAVHLNKQQVKDSPDIDTERPIEREDEATLGHYYGYPNYWGGPYRWGDLPYPELHALGGFTPGPLEGVSSAVAQEVRARAEQTVNPRLHSAEDVTGYSIQAADGSIGHVEDWVIDDRDWAIRYLIIDTVNWLPGKKVLVASNWIDRISYEDSKVYVDMTREAIKSAPEYHPERLDRTYEDRLHRHYGKRGYWDQPPDDWRVLP